VVNSFKLRQDLLIMNSTLIAAFEEKQPAEDLTGYLVKQNIPAAIVDLTVSGPGHALPAEFAKYQVRVSGEDAAAAVQATSHTDEGLRLISPAIRCPDCGSLRVRYPEMPRNFVAPFFFRLLVKLKLMEGSYACLTCKREWSPAKAREGKRTPVSP
jgi:DNA-directed RNA polymerase subunit RPC12/RpoP